MLFYLISGMIKKSDERERQDKPMITAGIIAEYNPFHRGHRYHIRETRKKTGADYIIAVMSGDYVQRGEPAAADKYLRTRLALEGGADLVIELPVIYSTASAEYFASAGVRLLHNLGCVDYLSFGSERAEVKDYAPLVKILSEESAFFRQRLREELKMGKNFPLARKDAVKACAEREYPEKKILWDILETPNHILGLEYLKALDRMNSPIIPVTVRREGAGYHDENIRQKYPSASAIRKMLLDGGRENALCDLLTEAMGGGADLLLSHWQKDDTVCWDDLMRCLDYAILMEEEDVEEFFGFDVDMAARLQKMHKPGCSFSFLLDQLHTKRLTDAAWRRALLHRVLHIKKEDFLSTAADVPVPYARVLGFAKRAAPLLKRIRAQAEIPLIQKPAQRRKSFKSGSAAERLFEADIRAAQLYEQTAAAKSGRAPVSEWVRQQIIL